MAAANVIRELFVALGVKVDPKSKSEVREFDKAIDRIKGQMQDLGDYTLRATKWLAGLAVAGAGAAGLLAVQTGQAADEIERQARALNLTRQEYQEFQHLFGTFGSDSKEISEAFLQITEKASSAVQGEETVAKEFALIGLRVDQLKGKRPNELFDLVADAMHTTTDRQKALSAASKLFGEDTAKKLLPALVQGSGALRRMRDEAHELGLVMSDEQIRAAQKVSKSWRDLTGRARGLRNELGVALAPVVERILRGAERWIKANRQILSQQLSRWVRTLERSLIAADEAAEAIGGWDVVFLNVATGIGLVYLLANLDKLVDFLKAANLAVTALKVGLTSLAAAAGVPFAPFLLILALVVANIVLLGLAVDDMITTFQGGRSVLGAFFDWLEGVVPGFKAWRELVAALVERFGVGVTNIVRLKDAIVAGLNPAFTALERIVAGVVTQLERAWGWVDRLVSAPLEGLTNWVRGDSNWWDAQGAAFAGQVQGNVAGAVERQVGGSRAGGSTDNSVRSVTANSHFYGATGSNVHDALEGAVRKASLAVRGSER